MIQDQHKGEWKRVAIIGAGIFMKEVYLQSIIANWSRVRLTAILSRTSESIDAALSAMTTDSHGMDSIKRYTEPEEEKFFAEAEGICDAIIIVVPIPLLGKYVEKCLVKAPSHIHILSEKPVAVTSVEAKRLISLYRTSPRSGLWHVAENYRLEPAVLYARDFVKGQGGKPKTFSLVCIRQQSANSKYMVTSWRSKPTYHGSSVLDGGIHFIALMRKVIGDGDDAVTDIRAHYEEQDVCEVGTCGSCRVGQALGTFQIRYGAFVEPVCRLDVYFDDAMISIVQIKGFGYEVSCTGRETQRFPFKGLEVEFELWVDSIQNGRAMKELEPEEGLADLLVIEEMCRQ